MIESRLRARQEVCQTSGERAGDLIQSHSSARWQAALCGAISGMPCGWAAIVK